MKINPNTIRNLGDYTLSLNDTGEIVCSNPDNNDFLYELISVDHDRNKLIFKLDEEITVDENDVVLDGNIRMFLLNQLRNLGHPYELIIKPFKKKTVKAINSDLYLYQVKANSGNKVSVRDRLKAIKKFMVDYIIINPSVDIKAIRKEIKSKYGETLYNYACLLERYERIPDWLKNDSDQLDVAISVALKFYSEFGDDKDTWKKIVNKSFKLRDGKIKITSKQLEDFKMIRDSVSTSSTLLSGESVEQLSDSQLRDIALSTFQTIKVKIPSVSLDDYDCKNWKRLLSILDEFAYILENV